VRLHQTVIDAAVAAGIRRIVYSSFTTAAPGAIFTFAHRYYATEQDIPGWRSCAAATAS